MRLPSGIETTVSIRDLAPKPTEVDTVPDGSNMSNTLDIDQPVTHQTIKHPLTVSAEAVDDMAPQDEKTAESQSDSTTGNSTSGSPRRSTRVSRMPKKFEDYVPS